jgi:hypothetical protein
LGLRKMVGSVTLALEKELALSPVIERWLLLSLLAGTFAVRALNPDQAIVENYVGRQIPTAMVARNLERGSGFLRPQLDTGPFPNLFVVEPPIFAMAAMELRRLFLLRLEPAGRLVSALGIAVGAWGLYGLTRRREGAIVALMAVAAFALFPVTIRYGRAFQPDALMLGSCLAGLRCWDEHESEGGWGWLVVGWGLLATGLALKVITAYLLMPICFAIIRPRRRWKFVFAVSTLIPALVWYWHAAQLLRSGHGSLASAKNAAIWLSVLFPSALLQLETYRGIARHLLVRAFTPVGASLAALGWVRGHTDRLWSTWWLSAALGMLVVAAKIHHEYYWLALAPLMAVGVARGLRTLWKWGIAGRASAVLFAGGFLLLASIQSASTWRTPAEWSQLDEAAVEVRAIVRPDQLLAASEALLYAADRQGARLELDAKSVRRAASEWGDRLDDDTSSALLECYRLHGVAFFADTGTETEPKRRDLHEAVRLRYLVLIDRPGLLIASLTPPPRGGAANGRR